MMAKIIIEIETDTVAFEDGGGSEVKRILDKLGNDFDTNGFYIYDYLDDANGNRVGYVSFIDSAKIKNWP